MKIVEIIATVCAGLYRVICLSLQKFVPTYTGTMPQCLIVASVFRSENNRFERKYSGQQSLSGLHASRKIEALKLQ